MAFDPDKITKQNILDAVSKIEAENIELEPSTRFDVIINGKTYPPKEVMRYAHEFMNGEHIWERSGGEPTNKYLIALGFEIKSKSDLASAITGNIWKLGCNWGSGKPSFYNYIHEEEIVIGVDDKKYNIGDLIVVAEGHQVNAIARINESPKSVTSKTALKKQFEKLEIEYDDWVNYANAEWYELDETDTFSYQLQQGICKVKNSEIRKKVIDLWNSRNSNCWIFQGNPNDFDYETAIKNNLLDNWTVSAHKDKIKTGDKVILWISGKKAGCYALAEITHEPQIIEKTKDSDLWKREDKNTLKAGIKITNNLLINPILWDTIKAKKGLENLKVGNQGTNFSATKQEFNIIKSMVMENSNVKNEFIDWFIKKGNYTQLNSPDKVNAELETYKNFFDRDLFKVNSNTFQDLVTYLKDVPNNKEFYAFSQSRSNHRPMAILGKNNYIKFLKEKFVGMSDGQEAEEENGLAAKNIILYGPPGTGKTYESIDYAVKIATGKLSSDHADNKVTFDELRQVGQIEFVTFHQNYSYEDFVVGIKPDVEFEQLRFKPHKGIFYEIARRARENYFASKERRSKEKDFDSVLEEIFEPVHEGKEVEIKMVSKKSFWITDVNTNSIAFRKASGGTAHTLSIDTLGDLVAGTRNVPSGLASYYLPLIELIKNKQKIEGKAETIENYVLVIDEINRANISKVFGELITLLEDDKRLGEENELKVSLPNGEKEFGVPPNLFIIGTMNTADKSIALIDIALRRRFEFIGFYPKYEGYNDDAISLLQKINATIFEKKKSADYLIGHAYFMNSQQLEKVLKNKIIPLLMEYFSGKVEVVTSIFEGTEWNINYDSTKYCWNILKK
jgi:hypothetical protein